ncbi:MAG: ACP S-malonyltransferase [Acidobacteria bacterium]|nr:ACP S-malonyltransferase [Acidobacteriota bacterium]
MIAFLFPGQGSQEVGMGRALAQVFVEARATFEEADAAFGDAPEGRSLQTLCFKGPEDQLMLTEHTQPAMLTVSIAAARVLASRGIQPDLVAGHSLGEYSANVAAGTFGLADAVRVVRRRGRYMQEAVPVGQGAMAAILGLDVAAVRRACEDAAQGEVVSPANINSPDQVVIAGATAAVRRAGARAKALGAKRVVPLPVSAPFHCALMKPAEERLAPDLGAIAVQDPRVAIVANVDAKPKREGGAAIDALVRQVSLPVLWEAVMHRLASEGVTTYVEVGPGRVLSGLARKIHKDAAVYAFGAPEDLDSILAHARPVR